MHIWVYAYDSYDVI